MKTKIYDVSDLEIIKTDEYMDIKMSEATDAAMTDAANVIARGGICAFPTETVYGIGANALDYTAVLKIFTAKGRPADNPLIVHIARARDIEKLAIDISVKTIKLIDTFWPGPLTVVLRKSPAVSDIVTAGLSTVAIRTPSDPVALELIRRSNCAIAAPSANISGRPSPTSPEHVIADLDGKVDVILKGRSCDVGIESTVIDMTTDPPCILRPGIITADDIEQIIGPVGVAPLGDPAKPLGDPIILDHPTRLENPKSISVGATIGGPTQTNPSAPRAPGMKYRHYAPQGKMTILPIDWEINLNIPVGVAPLGDPSTKMHTEQPKSPVGVAPLSDPPISVGNGSKPSQHNTHTAYILTDESYKRHADKLSAYKLYNLGPIERPEIQAQRLFNIFRTCDKDQITQIFCEAVPEEGIGIAIMNRIRKAAE